MNRRRCQGEAEQPAVSIRRKVKHDAAQQVPALDSQQPPAQHPHRQGLYTSPVVLSDPAPIVSTWEQILTPAAELVLQYLMDLEVDNVVRVPG